MQKCTQCGTEIPPGAFFCPQCGQRRQEDNQATARSRQSGPRTPNPTLRSKADLPTVIPGSLAGKPSSGATFPQNTRPGPYLASPNTSAPAYDAAPTAPYQQPSSPYVQPAAAKPSPYASSSYVPNIPYGNPIPSAPPLPTRQYSLSRNMLALIIGLTLILLISGTGLIYYSTVYYPAKQSADATSTASVGTQTAAARATSGEVAQATSTAITQRTKTVQAQATTQALQAIYTQATAGTPAVSDPLSGQSSSNWMIYDAQGGGGCAFTNNALHSTVQTKGYYVPCTAQALNFTDLAIEVAMTVVSGEGGGILFRTSATTDNSYFLYISSDGYYYLTLRKGAQSTGQTLTYSQSAAIHTGKGQSNTLTLIARGSTFYIYINKQYVTNISDKALVSGSIALAGVLTSNAAASQTEVAFQNLSVWKL